MTLARLSMLVVTLAALSAPARADDAPSVADEVAAGERHYAELDYRAAAEQCGRAARDPRATVPEQVRAWERVGLAWLVLGQRRLAKEAFDHLFTLDTARVVEEPSLSPRQRAFIEEARQAHPVVTPEPGVTPEPVVAAPGIAPVAVPAPPPARRPIYKRWYLWTPIAVVLVGAGVGVGLALGLPRDAAHGTLPPGTTSLALHF